MDIGLSIAVDLNSDQQSPNIQYISNLLEDAFRTRSYNIINHYWILCQVQKTIPGLEHFTKIPRHRFVEKLHFRNLDNSYTDYYGVYTCGFKIDFEEYDAFVAATDEEAKRIIARKVVESLSNLDRLSRKAAGFDKERFKSDVIKLFKDNDLL